LDDTATSYCCYDNPKQKRHLMELNDLKAAILFAMKENLMIQLVYPDYELSETYKAEIESIDHSKVMPSTINTEEADVIIFNGWSDFSADFLAPKKAIVLRTTKQDLFSNYLKAIAILEKNVQLNIVITDVETFTEVDFKTYKNVLNDLQLKLKDLYAKSLLPQLNILTIRLMSDKMNSCNAGVENITLAPNGKFYICPAFYLENEMDSIGDLTNGLNIKNKQLYKLDHAPICRTCDAFQCKRCVWLNRKTTLDINTPSHEQCVVSHLERNTSRELLSYFPDKEIKEIDYLDPFDVRKEI
jgi:CXXX repeat peptide maturase